MYNILPVATDRYRGAVVSPVGPLAATSLVQQVGRGAAFDLTVLIP